jgi:predicted amidohydrolase
MSGLTRLALHSAVSRLGDVAANVAAVAKAVTADKADLVAFPEMFLTGYNVGDDAQRLAFTLDDERLEPIRRAAAKARSHVVVGGPRTARKGVTYNSAVLIGPDGTTEAYDKRVLANYTTFQEGLFFRRGATDPVFDTAAGKVGISICYDLFFPEFQRRQALAGADLLLNISASPITSQRFFEALFPARAIENASFVAYTNLVGPQDGIVFWGGAQAWNPRGQRMATSAPMKAGKVVVEIDWDDLSPAREFRPTLRDVRAEDLDDLTHG